MSTVEFHLADTDILALRKRAAELHVDLDDLIRLSVKDLLSQSDSELERLLHSVIEERSDVLKRLA